MPRACEPVPLPWARRAPPPGADEMPCREGASGPEAPGGQWGGLVGGSAGRSAAGRALLPIRSVQRRAQRADVRGRMTCRTVRSPFSCCTAATVATSQRLVSFMRISRPFHVPAIYEGSIRKPRSARWPQRPRRRSRRPVGRPPTTRPLKPPTGYVCEPMHLMLA
jgi:hypothetical protein